MKKLLFVLIACLFIMLAGCDEFLETTPSEGDTTNSTTQATEQESTPETETTIPSTTESIPEETEAPPYPMQIVSDEYSGPECWLLSEPSDSTSEILFEVYADIDTSNENWHEQVKSIIALMWSQYSDNEKVMFKIYNGTDGLENNQPTYEDLIAIWQNKPFSVVSESKPTITWYPNGAGVAAQQETENWNP